MRLIMGTFLENEVCFILELSTPIGLEMAKFLEDFST